MLPIKIYLCRMKKRHIYSSVIFLSVFVFCLTNLNAQFSPSKNRLVLTFVGDFMGHKDQINSAYNSKTKTYDYNECFQYVAPILKKSDIAIGNLEVTLGVKPYSGYPQFSSPAAYAAAIKNAGIDVLMTANNHACDKRKKGVESTIAILDSLNIKHTGTFYSEDLKKPLVITKNGIKVAFLNYTYGTNGIAPTKPNVVNYLDKEVIKKDISSAKAKKPDIIIAYVHWGTQYKSVPSNYQKQWYQFFKTQGIGIVIGSHPHVLQPMLLDKKTTSLVVYSLGNFVSHQRTFPRDGGAILNLTLKKQGKKIIIEDVNYQLTWVYEPIINGKKNYYILLVNSFKKDSTVISNKRDIDKMMRFVTYTRKLLNSKNKDVVELKTND